MFEERRSEEIGESMQPKAGDTESPFSGLAKLIAEELPEIEPRLMVERGRIEPQQKRVDALRPGADRRGAHVGSTRCPRAFTEGEASRERSRFTSA